MHGIGMRRLPLTPCPAPARGFKDRPHACAERACMALGCAVCLSPPAPLPYAGEGRSALCLRLFPTGSSLPSPAGSPLPSLHVPTRVGAPEHLHSNQTSTLILRGAALYYMQRDAAPSLLQMSALSSLAPSATGCTPEPGHVPWLHSFCPVFAPPCSRAACVGAGLFNDS